MPEQPLGPYFGNTQLEIFESIHKLMFCGAEIELKAFAFPIKPGGGINAQSSQSHAPGLEYNDISLPELNSKCSQGG